MEAIDLIETLCEQVPKDEKLQQIAELINTLNYAQAIIQVEQFLQESNE